MADEQEGTHTPDSKDAATDSGDKKLIFGKYKTIEEAEKAHKDLERRFHGDNERFSRLEERFELLESSRQADSGHRDDGYSRGYATQDATPDNTRVLTEFYKDPARVLAEVEERATAKAEQRISQRQQQNNDHASRVSAWTEKNSDVTKYPELLTYWVGQTDGRLSIETRLEKAAKRVRERIIELRGKPETVEPKPDDVVEGVDHSGSTTPAKGARPVVSDPESQLASYASDRNKQVRRPLNTPRAK